MVVSGGRDRSLCAWSASSGGFLFARRYLLSVMKSVEIYFIFCRYCHGGEITAVDVTAREAVINTGYRVRNVLF